MRSREKNDLGSGLRAEAVASMRYRQELREGFGGAAERCRQDNQTRVWTGCWSEKARVLYFVNSLLSMFHGGEIR
jgi:hypothetical protein